ncbi:MAG: branched-chain amino acid aminotransferase [Bacteroidales bacterium]|nr:branched-chain amino acid aminotransferase [Bacteroidales bacterium]MDD3167356.1 branched-chain amino acid aminotransferase [Bacteroidales bacterium]MDD4771868.1 branched-chain amino acid aminotransferase [Bacteroidales bacterium]
MGMMNWSELSFGYLPTDYNVRCYYRDGKWGDLEVSSSENITMHMGATCLHYGQEAFEGLKAFRGPDEKIRVFRVDENAKRMQTSAEAILMEAFPVEKFKEAVIKAVQLNKRFVPPFESGASLYIRPLLIGTGPKVGVQPSDEYLFIIFVTPVGPYFKGGFKPANMVIMREYDRAAPHGTGTIKVGGNYAASLKSGELAHKMGYASVLYLDAREKKYIDECGAANFFMIKGNTYATPESTSILPSITNKSLMQLAKDMGMTVEKRPIALDELEDFEEVGACGTAAVITPIGRIDDADTGKQYEFATNGQAGPVCLKLYQTLRGIQYGELPDPYGWTTIID